MLVWSLQNSWETVHQRPFNSWIVHLKHTQVLTGTWTRPGPQRHRTNTLLNTTSKEAAGEWNSPENRRRTLKFWNMSRFCCLNWKYWASSRNVSPWSNFRALRKRRMKSSSVLRNPMSGRVTIMSRTSRYRQGERGS